MLNANYSGVPPKEVVDRLHAANIPVMNMIGHPKHIAKALEAGVDIFCAQGGGRRAHRRCSILRTSFRRPLLKPPLQ